MRAALPRGAGRHDGRADDDRGGLQPVAEIGSHRGGRQLLVSRAVIRTSWNPVASTSPGSRCPRSGSRTGRLPRGPVSPDRLRERCVVRWLGQRAAPVGAADGEHAGRPQHAAHLGQSGRGGADVLEQCVAEDDVEARIGRRAGRLRDPCAPRSTCRAARGPDASRVASTCVGSMSRAATRPGATRRARPDRDRTGPAADVEQVQAGTQVGQRERALPPGGASLDDREHRGAVARKVRRPARHAGG
jgi:hypothetical protein